MKTFQLKKGVLQIEGDRILISGGQAGYVKLLHLLAAVCWVVFFTLQGQKHYKTYLITHGLSQLLFAAFSAAVVLFWLYVGYTRGIKDASRDEINLKQIVKVQKENRAANQVPILTLVLKNNRRRTLEFNELEDLHFAESLAGRGVPVVE
ncbi:hypothetical protein [Rufibacter tibetensis]|uniref:Uncharacterized protein n=1 Tax=Rufibacter tibetensis TaxID=512763 RepID=A0A0P0CMZ9_9BACT|nr:hypothetical protein [Rufibacter tibetensis]ALJ01054.1 hypothetical protein DC20_21230 [Rufibacter tibetensis]